MFRINYWLLLLPLLACVSCGKSKDANDLTDASPADSLMYYFGEMQAYNYFHDAQADTILKSDEAKKAFMEGFRKGLDSEKDDPAYNKGIQEGLRLAIRLKELQKAYGMEFPESMLADAFELYLNDEDGIQIADAQKEYYKIKDRLDIEKGLREDDSSRKALAKAAEKEHFIMISDTLYGKDVTAATPGPKFRDGDKVEISLTAATLNGSPLGKQFPPKIEIGAGRVPRVVCLAICTMTNGQTRTFMTTPQALFGKQYERYHLTATDPVIFTIKAERLKTSESTDNTEPAVL